MNARIHPSLREQMLREPHLCFHAIVRTKGDAEPVARTLVDQTDVVVHHTFRLLPGFSVTAPGDALLMLAHLPAVVAIDPDPEVVAAAPGARTE